MMTKCFAESVFGSIILLFVNWAKCGASGPFDEAKNLFYFDRFSAPSRLVLVYR